MRTPALLATIIMSLSAPYAASAQPAETAEPIQTRSNQGVFTTRTHPDGSVDIQNVHRGLQGAGVWFDITDELMRSQGMDPYTDRKLGYLDATRERRVAMGREYRIRQYAHSGEAMQKNIDAVWRALPDLAQRKQALFALWDECAESGDPALVAGGQRAREKLVSFVRENLTGPYAYTPEELAQLNAHRTSAAPFDPYGDAQPRVAQVTRRTPSAVSR